MKKKSKQILAIGCIVLLVFLYILTFFSAILDFPGSDRLFLASLFATVAMPLLLWIYIWLYGQLTKKKTMSDLFPKE